MTLTLKNELGNVSWRNSATFLGKILCWSTEHHIFRVEDLKIGSFLIKNSLNVLPNCLGQNIFRVWMDRQQHGNIELIVILCHTSYCIWIVQFCYCWIDQSQLYLPRIYDINVERVTFHYQYCFCFIRNKQLKMTSLHVSAKPKLFVCNENGMECFYAPCFSFMAWNI